MRGIEVNGTAIRLARQFRNWTQEQMGEECSCSVRTIRAAEAGRRIDHATLQRMADALEMSTTSITKSQRISLPERERNMQTVRQWRAAFFAQDVESLLRLQHPDCAVSLPGTDELPHGGNFKGVPELRAHYRGVFESVLFRDLHEERLSAVEHQVFHWSTVTVVVLATQQEFTATHASRFEFSADKIIFRETVADYSKFREALEQ